MRVLFVASELNPIAKVGGLADVAGALPKEIEKNGVDIEIAIPFYDVIDTKKYDCLEIIPTMEIEYRGNKVEFSVWKTTLPGSRIPVYLIKNKNYLSNGGIYLSKNAFCDSHAEVIRFEFLGHAIWKLFETGFFIHDVIHCQDWHTGYLASIAKRPTLFTIHNLANQGKIGRGPNYMKLGIEHATIINAVSPTYAKEILTFDYGENLDLVLRKRKDDLFGIINGIDYDLFDPSTDPALSKHYSEKTVKDKVISKIHLQREVGLMPSEDKIVLGLVSRLTSQKAIDRVTRVLRSVLHLRKDVYFVGLGVGEPKLEKMLVSLQKKFKEQSKVFLKFDATLAQKIYAGSDIFLMPSNFEPCGLCQMIAMRYGNIPIVRKTGGLADSVTDEKDGFVFARKSDREFAAALNRSLKKYEDKKAWDEMIHNAMTKGFTWEKPAKEYIKLYKLAIEHYRES